ncbi:MAG: FapA family protein [Pseudomonadales bacterium]
MEPAHAAVELNFDADSGLLYACITPAEGPIPLGQEALVELIEAAGYGAFSFQPDALAGVLRRLQKLEFGDVAIASRLDAGATVLVSADGLTACLTTTASYGGAPLDETAIRQALRDEHICDDLVIADAVTEALAQGEVEKLIVAEGIPPKAGSDSYVELLVDLTCEISRPREDDNGKVDHYSVREFVVVEAGDRVLRRFPPTAGSAGRDVFGKSIAAQDGKDVPLPKEMSGVRPSDDDPDLFVAEFKGHPVAIPGGVRVDKTLPLDFVDLRTGNVKFDGSVLVAGDVAAGVTVIATGDITVKGTVENAFLEAGGDLVVGCGITGSESAMSGGQREVMAEAAGSVHAAFASGVRLQAGEDVVIKEYLNHCDTYASGHVLVGQSGGHGVIVGGRCHGCQGVSARVLGSAGSVPTRVRAGVHEALRRTQREALDERRGLVARLEQLNAMLASMQEEGGDDAAAGRNNLVDKVRRTIEDFERRTSEVNGRIDAISERLDSANAAAVVGDLHVHPGVVVEIADAVLPLRSDSPGTRFVCRGGEIQTE